VLKAAERPFAGLRQAFQGLIAVIVSCRARRHWFGCREGVFSRKFFSSPLAAAARWRHFLTGVCWACSGGVDFRGSSLRVIFRHDRVILIRDDSRPMILIPGPAQPGIVFSASSRTPHVRLKNRPKPGFMVLMWFLRWSVFATPGPCVPAMGAGGVRLFRPRCAFAITGAFGQLPPRRAKRGKFSWTPGRAAGVRTG